MDIQLLTARDAVDALAPEWGELHREDPASTPFMSPWWGLAWLRHLGDAGHPWVITARHDGRLVGIAPLILQRRGGIRLLRVIGKEPADYWDLLASPEHRAAFGTAVASKLEVERGAWDQLVLDCLPPGSPTYDVLSRRRHLTIRQRSTVPCPGFDLPTTFEAFLERFSSKRRTKMRRHLRRVDEGEVELTSVKSPDAIPSALGRWQELRLRQWEDRPGEIMPLHRTEPFREFLTSAALDLIPRELALLWELRVGGELVGSYLNFADSTTFYNYLGGFDPSSHRLRLGTIAVLLGVRESIRAGRTYFDFLVGAEEYKYEYGSKDRHLRSIAVANRRLRSRLILGLSAARDRARVPQPA